MIETKNNRICVVCDKPYYRRGKRIPKTCSMKCRAKYYSTTKLGVGRKKFGVYQKCLTCKDDMYVTKGEIGRRKFCSMDCRNNAPFTARGEKSWNWKGGTVVLGGYRYIKSYDHPNRNSGNYMAEHRLVMEKHIGRYLKPNEEVHHRNQDKLDNRISNLEIVLKKAHWGIVSCPHCQKEFNLK